MSGKTIHRIVGLTALTLFFVGMGVSTASADTATIYLNSGNSGLAGASGSYAKVELSSPSAGTVIVTVTAAPGFGLFGNGQGAGMFGFNGPAGLTVTSLTAGVGVVDGSNSSMSSFGKFTYKLDGPPASGALSTFSFSVTGGAITAATLVAAVNASGWNFGAHIAANGDDGWFAGAKPSDTSPTSTPEPASITTLTVALLGLAFVRKKLVR